ncbi:SpoIIE family protein phosphatase [Streptomyces pathocidini]|uniref:SpoIIE family protein phosphatase n=1 Tax=Streptomyces pathocidini TaxID=1650571 RepID=A0ABW7UW94_9ACTN|nr:SpoIIE family protein phosphatase [Streptomyces pathocidini]
MVDRGTPPTAAPLPDAWPLRAETNLALNRMGSFDWDVDNARLHMDAPAMEVFDLEPGEFDGDADALGELRVPPDESDRLNAMVAQAFKDGSTTYGAYFRVRCRDGSLRWTHTQGHIERDGDGRPYRVLGIVRDATEELAHAAERIAVAEERQRQTNLIDETTAALARAITVQDVIEVLGDTRGLGRLGAISILMGLLEDGRVHVVAERQADNMVPELEYTRIEEEFPMSEVIRTLSPRLITSPGEFASRYPRLWPHVKPIGVTAAAYLPLIAQARPIGALGLLFRGRRDFTPEERNLLVALSSGIAQSLQRAMLFDQEHDIAEGLQTAMLPRSVPSFPGARIAVRYRSARFGRDVGGDWYDVIPVPGGRIGAVIGDVQGHDTHAAAVMGQLRIALRAYASEGHAPATVMARASVFLHELDTDRFATCSYAEVDPAEGTVQLVRAGHMDPMVRHPDGSCRQLPVAGGLPLGLSAQFGHTDYPVTRMVLGPGETLLLFTDGLVEQPGKDMDDGLRLLTDAVCEGPHRVEELADHVGAVMGERTGGDDMAILLLRREGEPIPEIGRRVHQHIAPADPEGLTMARHMISEAVRTWGARERADEVELVADELITNALLHTDGGAVVTLRMLGGAERRLRVEVQDMSSSWPRRREPGETGVSGRGLLLVDRLADVWGVESRGSGKSVWSEFILQDWGGE